MWASEHTAAAWGHRASRKGVEGGLYAILSDGLAPIYRQHSLMRHHITTPIYGRQGGCLGGGLLGCREGADALEGAELQAHSLRGLGDTAAAM